MSLPDLPLPTPGQRHWAEPLNASLEALNDALGAIPTTEELNDAVTAAETARDQAEVFAAGTVALQDTAIASRVADPDSETHAAVATAIANTIPSIMAPPPNGVDDTDALLDVIASAPGQVVELHKGEYKISQPLPFNASIIGQGQRATVIKCLPGFTGGMMIDFFAGTGEARQISGLGLDAQYLAGVQHFGSSTGNAEGSAKGRFTDIRFMHSAPGVYSVGGSSTVAAPGMLTGAIFERCDWDSCAQWIHAGQNQDDVTFISCRGNFAAGNLATGYVIRLTGNNIRFINSFFHLAHGTNYVTGGIRPFALIGSFLVKFEQTFFEDQTGTSNFTHLFHAAGPRITLDIDQTRLNLAGETPSLTAVIRSQVSASQPVQSTLRVNGLTRDAGRPASLTLLDMYVPGGLPAGVKLTLDMSNIDDVDTLVTFAPSGDTASTAPVVRLWGMWRGMPFVNAHLAPASATPEQAIQFWSPTNSRYFRADQAGIFHSGRAAVGVNGLPEGVNLSAYATSATNKALVARAASGQTANIQEWQDSSGTPLAYVNRLGHVVAAQFRGPASTTANRPSSAIAGVSYFDTTIGKPIWFNGTTWIDATGASV